MCGGSLLCGVALRCNALTLFSMRWLKYGLICLYFALRFFTVQ